MLLFVGILFYLLPKVVIDQSCVPELNSDAIQVWCWDYQRVLKDKLYFHEVFIIVEYFPVKLIIALKVLIFFILESSDFDNFFVKLLINCLFLLLSFHLHSPSSLSRVKVDHFHLVFEVEIDDTALRNFSDLEWRFVYNQVGKLYLETLFLQL